MFQSLRHKNFRIFLLGNLVSLVGTWMQSLAMGWLVYRLTSSPFMLGLIGFAHAIPVWFMWPFCGVIADTIPKKRLIIETQFIFMMSAFVVWGLTALNTITATDLFLLALINGAASAIDTPARQAFVVEMVGRKHLMDAIALNSLAFNSARILGPVVGGYMVALVGEQGCFLFNALSFLAVLAALFAMKMTNMTPVTNNDGMFRNIIRGWEFLRKDPVIPKLLALAGVQGLLSLPYFTMLPVFVRDTFKREADALGFLMSCVGMGAVAGALAVARVGHSRRKGYYLMIGAISSATAIGFFGMSRNYTLSCLLLVVVGFSNVLALATGNTLIQKHSPDEFRGRAMSFYSLIFIGFMPVGNLILGFLAEKISPSLAVSLCASSVLAFTLFMNWRFPRLKRLR